MNKYIKPVLLISLGMLLGSVFSDRWHFFNQTAITAGYRDLEMKLDVTDHEVMIWKTVIAPQQKNTAGIALHRHEYPRVLIPLTEGVLQRWEPNGSTTDYVLHIGKPILLPEDTADGFHTDENVGDKAIEVIVIQFTQSPVAAEQLTEADFNTVVLKP